MEALQYAVNALTVFSLITLAAAIIHRKSTERRIREDARIERMRHAAEFSRAEREREMMESVRKRLGTQQQSNASTRRSCFQHTVPPEPETNLHWPHEVVLTVKQ